MKSVVTMNTPLMSKLELDRLVRERRETRTIWLKSSNGISNRENKVYASIIGQLDYQIETLRNALKGSEGLIQASCN